MVMGPIPRREGVMIPAMPFAASKSTSPTSLPSTSLTPTSITAAPGLIHPSIIEAGVMHRDLPIMFGLSIALYIMAFGRDGTVGRVNGTFLLLAFAAYQFLLYTASVK